MAENLAALQIPVPETDPVSHASNDSGNVSHRVPYLLFGLAIHPDATVAVHTPEFAVATDSDLSRERMNQAAKAMAMCALDLLVDQGRLAEIQAELREHLVQAEYLAD